LAKCPVCTFVWRETISNKTRRKSEEYKKAAKNRESATVVEACPERMYKLGTNREGKLRQQLAKPSSGDCVG